MGNISRAISKFLISDPNKGEGPTKQRTRTKKLLP